MVTTDISEILQQFRQITQPQLVAISDWWQHDHSNVTIHYISFRTPIYGGVLTPTSLAINNNIKNPYLILFLTAHESFHLDQYSSDPDGFTYGYFGTVVDNDLDGFLKAYQVIEKEANDYAFSTMLDLGFSQIVSKLQHLRGNEQAGQYVFDIIRQKIKNNGVTDMFEAIRSSIF